MPFTFTIDATTPRVHIQGNGWLTCDDLDVLLTTLITHNVYTLPRLIDLRAAAIRHFPAEIERCAAMVMQHNQRYGGCRAAALTHDLATHGVLCMYQTLSTGRDPGFGVFRTLPTALAWLYQHA